MLDTVPHEGHRHRAPRLRRWYGAGRLTRGEALRPSAPSRYSTRTARRSSWRRTRYAQDLARHGIERFHAPVLDQRVTGSLRRNGPKHLLLSTARPTATTGCRRIRVFKHYDEQRAEIPSTADQAGRNSCTTAPRPSLEEPQRQGERARDATGAHRIAPCSFGAGQRLRRGAHRQRHLCRAACAGNWP